MKRHVLNRFLIACLILLIQPGSYNAKAQVSPALADSLQARLDQLCISHQVKGISAAVYSPVHGTWSGATGFSYGSVPIDTDMLFNMGSITKSFVAAEILKLQEQGLLDIDDSIKDYLPAHQYIDSNITIRQMLNHTSGIGEVLNSSWQTSINSNPSRWWNAQETIDTFLVPAAFQPGQSWSYCNTNYLLLQLIIEHIKQDTLTHVLRADFIDPLGLSETYMHMREHFTNTIPHNWSNPNMIPGQGIDASSYDQTAASTSTSAAGGLYTSAADLARWGHNLYSGNVISQASLQEMMTFVNLTGSYYNGYGLGCMRFPYAGKTYIGHAGNFFGMAASLFYYPQDGTTVAVLVNEDCISPYITREFFESLLNAVLNAGSITSASHKFNLYPNPATDKVSLNINVAKPADATVNIYSVTGKKYLTMQVKMQTGDNVLDIPTAKLSSGLYYCELQSDGNRFTEKLVVQ